MAITAADLKAFGAVNMVEDDTSTVGGAIALTTRVGPMPWPATETPKGRSDNAGDTMNMTVGGLDAAGAINEDTIALVGTAPQTFTSFSRILKFVLASTAAGIVTLYRNDDSTVVVALAIGELANRGTFYDTASIASVEIWYEKIYWKNDHGTLTLNAAELELTADPQARIQIGVEDSADQTSTNRLTPPTSVTFVDDSVLIDITSLAAGASVGLWIEMNLPANDPAFNSSYTTQLDGTTAA